MTLERPRRRDADEGERRLFGVLAIVTVVVLVGAMASAGYVVYQRASAPPSTVAPATETPTATVAAPGEPSLIRDVPLLDAPDDDASVILQLAVGDAIRVLGRSPNGEWLVVGLRDQREPIGWVPLAAVAGVGDGLPLTVVSIDGNNDVADDAPAVPTLTPDLPDLRVVRAFSRQNQLHVEVSNEGAADLDARLLVSVNEGEPLALEVHRAERLRPGQRLEAPVPGEYVQLRGLVLVTVSADPPLEEESAEGQTWVGIVEPDEANDLEIYTAMLEEPDGALRVTVRNNSPIPIRGNITVTVREALPSTTLLGRQMLYVEMAPEEMLDVDFPEIAGIAIEETMIRLSTNAIQDAMIGNNIYPR